VTKHRQESVFCLFLFAPNFITLLSNLNEDRPLNLTNFLNLISGDKQIPFKKQSTVTILCTVWVHSLSLMIWHITDICDVTKQIKLASKAEWNHHHHIKFSNIMHITKKKKKQNKITQKSLNSC
jgi:hypothetical protein